MIEEKAALRVSVELLRDEEIKLNEQMEDVKEQIRQLEGDFRL
jgi:hypothetical protein